MGWEISARVSHVRHGSLSLSLSAAVCWLSHAINYLLFLFCFLQGIIIRRAERCDRLGRSPPSEVVPFLLAGHVFTEHNGNNLFIHFSFFFPFFKIKSIN